MVPSDLSKTKLFAQRLPMCPSRLMWAFRLANKPSPVACGHWKRRTPLKVVPVLQRSMMIHKIVTVEDRGRRPVKHRKHRPRYRVKSVGMRVRAGHRPRQLALRPRHKMVLITCLCIQTQRHNKVKRKTPWRLPSRTRTVNKAGILVFLLLCTRGGLLLRSLASENLLWRGFGSWYKSFLCVGSK